MSQITPSVRYPLVRINNNTWCLEMPYMNDSQSRSHNYRYPVYPAQQKTPCHDTTTPHYPHRTRGLSIRFNVARYQPARATLDPATDIFLRLPMLAELYCDPKQGGARNRTTARTAVRMPRRAPWRACSFSMSRKSGGEVSDGGIMRDIQPEILTSALHTTAKIELCARTAVLPCSGVWGRV